MKENLVRIAALLSVVIGLMAIFAGGQVLLGKVPDYYVIDWLPVYNFIIGVLSVFVTAVLIWKRSPYAWPAAVATLSAHVVVMLILQIGYSSVVARDSIMAMTIRISVWLLILALLFYSSRQGQTGTA
jgi:hypothetical protein